MKTIQSFDRQTGAVGLIDVDDDASCTILGCFEKLSLVYGVVRARPAVAVITNILPFGAVAIGAGTVKASTIYLCAVHLDETGEAESDTWADLQRAGRRL